MTKKTTVWGKDQRILVHMVFAQAEQAPRPRSETAKQVAWAYAGVLVVMALAQLFGFEKFIPILEDYGLGGGEGTATLVASIIVVAEVFALPFLVRMPLSRLMRWVSLTLAVLVPVIWMVLGFIVLMGETAVANSGILGAKVSVPGGVAQLLWAVGLAGLATWSAWGLWPLAKK